MTNNKPPMCCFCCHVKAGTIILALLYLVTSLFAIVIGSLALANLVDLNDGMFRNCLLPYNTELTSKQAVLVMFVQGLFLLLISTFAVYGVAKNRAGFILPLFIVKLFNFLCSMVYMGSVVFCWPSFKETLLQCPHIPNDWKESLIAMDERWLACIVFLTLFAVIFVKCYLISMVYRCYKHITLQVILRQRRQTEINYVSGSHEKPLTAHIHIYNPPKYEDIQKVPLVDDAEDMDVKPPPYSSA